MPESDNCKYLLRAADIRAAEETASHPWNPKSLLIGTHLSREAGLQRAGISRVRVPAGHESCVYHAHHREEEWVYVLAGRAIAEIDGAEYEVGPGDFMAFPTPSVAHHLRNPFDEDLVYLVGGENCDCEIADFPRLDRRMVRLRDKIDVYELSSGMSLGPLEDR